MLRKLEPKDALLMHEWMQDPTITANFKTAFQDFSLDEIMNFIESSFTDKNQHFAITNDSDEYMGTVSLKNISSQDKNAEYAIVLRKSAHHKGYGLQASREITDYAFNVLGLKKVYLNVFEDNFNARNLYEKVGFVQEGTFISHYCINEKYHNLCWYALYNKTFVNPHEVLAFKEHGDERGHLVVLEGCIDIPFDIKRVFYIYGSDSNIIRGQHANRKTEFVLINLAGTSKVKVDNGKEQNVICLDQPHIGIYIPKMLWKDMYDFSSDSVLLCLASEHYESSEYIRNYDDYLNEVNNLQRFED